MRKGIVVATHPEDHSVDLVMVDNGERLVGVQVGTPNGSSRSGTVDLPHVPDTKDKWDITKANGQDMHALVDYVGKTPVVTTFLFSQVNQMLLKDPKAKLSRHQSDVITMIDGNGNISLQHPSGAFFQMGSAPEAPSLGGSNADGNLSVDRNTGGKVFFRVALAGNAVEVTMTPDGTTTMKMLQDFNVETDGNINMKAKGNVSIEAEGTFSAKSGGAASIKGSRVDLN